MGGAALPFLLQRLLQDILLVLQHPMEVPHLLLVLSCLASKVLLLLYQTVTNVIQLQCSQLLVPLAEEEDSVSERGCLLPRPGPQGCIPDLPPCTVGDQ